LSIDDIAASRSGVNRLPRKSNTPVMFLASERGVYRINDRRLRRHVMLQMVSAMARGWRRGGFVHCHTCGNKREASSRWFNVSVTFGEVDAVPICKSCAEREIYQEARKASNRRR